MRPTPFQRWLQAQSFHPTPASLPLNPVYILRRGLYTEIRDVAQDCPGRVLDVGCGSKPYAGLFTKATQYVGVDVLASGHDHHDSRVDCFYDGSRLPFADNQFDAVVSFQTLEHVEQVDALLAELRRVLKPGGQIVLSVPFVWYEHEAPFDYRRFTSFGIRKALEDQQFDSVDVRKTTTFVLTLAQMVIAYLTFYLCPSNRWIRTLFAVSVTFPMTVLAYALNAVLPKRGEFYIDLVVKATKA